MVFGRRGVDVLSFAVEGVRADPAQTHHHPMEESIALEMALRVATRMHVLLPLAYPVCIRLVWMFYRCSWRCRAMGDEFHFCHCLHRAVIFIAVLKSGLIAMLTPELIKTISRS